MRMAVMLMLMLMLIISSGGKKAHRLNKSTVSRGRESFKELSRAVCDIESRSGRKYQVRIYSL
jgi:hypothetical protein